MAQSTCSIDACDKAAVARGWCPAHWWRWSKHGDPLADKPVRRRRALDHDDGTRTCNRCEARKPLDQYDRVANATLGRRSTCKACRSEGMRAWYAVKAEERAAAARVRRAANPEVYRQRDRDRANQPRRIEAHRFQTSKRRLRLSDTEADPGVTRANLRRQYGDSCFYCETPMSFARVRKGDPFPPDLATIEHVHPVSRGGTHTWDNVVLACWSCNTSKRHSSLTEWSPSRK